MCVWYMCVICITPVGVVFQVEEIMQALQQAFHSAFQQSVKNHIVCELCPMHQLHKLCQEIEGECQPFTVSSGQL